MQSNLLESDWRLSLPVVNAPTLADLLFSSIYSEQRIAPPARDNAERGARFLEWN